MTDAIPENTSYLLLLLPVLLAAAIGILQLVESGLSSSRSQLIRGATAAAALGALACAGLILHQRILLAQAYDFMSYVESGPFYLVRIQPTFWSRPLIVIAALLPAAFSRQRSATIP